MRIKYESEKVLGECGHIPFEVLIPFSSTTKFNYLTKVYEILHFVFKNHPKLPFRCSRRKLSSKSFRNETCFVVVTFLSVSIDQNSRRKTGSFRRDVTRCWRYVLRIMFKGKITKNNKQKNDCW